MQDMHTSQDAKQTSKWKVTAGYFQTNITVKKKSQAIVYKALYLIMLQCLCFINVTLIIALDIETFWTQCIVLMSTCLSCFGVTMDKVKDGEEAKIWVKSDL